MSKWKASVKKKLHNYQLVLKVTAEREREREETIRVVLNWQLSSYTVQWICTPVLSIILKFKVLLLFYKKKLPIFRILIFRSTVIILVNV